MVVVYAPTDQSSTEDKDHFHCDLESVMTRANRVTIVMGNFNATVGETVQGVVGPHGLRRKTTNIGEGLVSFATINGMCVTNTLFPHKHIHQTICYLPNLRAEPGLKDYVLV